MASLASAFDARYSQEKACSVVRGSSTCVPRLRPITVELLVDLAIQEGGKFSSLVASKPGGSDHEFGISNV